MSRSKTNTRYKTNRVWNLLLLKCTQYSQCPRSVVPKFWWGQETHLWLRRKQGLWEAVEVAKVELDACIGDSQLMHICGTVPWADIALSWERRHRDCVLQLILGQIVRNPSINVSLKSRQMQQSSFSQLITHLFYSASLFLFVPTTW